ncbi:oligosaccharide flippase family protein [Aphanizomenon sp. CS-733/32]|uniref:oligosaccharide flippase family protein n=1 Tax=Aphanizomenon sp. CS-733/32 TaxID=3021715 RepID=UPI00232F1513|nr:oligosaccharide flippase family protein [Aphanizomenon sp. CS-733/32]MDB9307538.1 oligosaccharide flippase family protein [Aphanizomenon sp. CS-733/32]
MNNNFLKNGLYNAAGGIIRIGLAILTIPLLIRLIGVEEYGLWTLSSTVITIVALAEAGLATATTVFVSQDLGKEDINELSQTLTVTVGGMLILATIAAIALFFGADGITDLFPKVGTTKHSVVVQALQIGGLVIWAKLFQQVLIGIEQAYQRYSLLNILNTIQNFLLSFGLFGVAWFGGRTVALMQWQALTTIVALLSHIWVVLSLIRGVNLKPIWKTEKVMAIANYSLTIWLMSLGTAVFSRGDRLIVGYFLGSETLGMYAGITDATSAINSFSALPVQPLVPVLSNYSATDGMGNPGFTQKIKQALEVNALFALASAGWLFMFAPLVMNLMFAGVATESTVLAFRIATLIYGLFSLNAVGFFILLSIAPKLVMIIQLISGCFSLTLIAIGASKFGFLGAVAGNIGFLLTWLMIFSGLKLLKLPKWFWLKSLIFPLIWFLICTLIGLLVSQLEFMVIISTIHVMILIGWFINIYKQTIIVMLSKTSF